MTTPEEARRWEQWVIDAMLGRHGRIEFYVPPDKSKKGAQNWRDLYRKLAERIGAGKSLGDTDAGEAHYRDLVANALRFVADGIPDAPPRKKGRPRKMAATADDIAFQYVFLRMKMMTQTAAIRQLAEEHDVSNEAIRQTVEKRFPGGRLPAEAAGRRTTASKNRSLPTKKIK